MCDTDQDGLRALLAEAKASGRAELANYQTFVPDLACALGLNHPEMAKEETRLNDGMVEVTPKSIRLRKALLDPH